MLLVQKKNRPQKLPLVATNNWIVLAARWSVKNFLLRIPSYSGKVAAKDKKQYRKTKAIKKRFDFQGNAKTRTDNPKLLMLSTCFTSSLIATFCIAHMKHFWTCLEGIYIITDNKKSITNKCLRFKPIICIKIYKYFLVI